jgi:hypothetical protein
VCTMPMAPITADTPILAVRAGALGPPA